MARQALSGAFSPVAGWDQRIEDIYRYWLGLCDRADKTRQRLPGRQHLDPIEIPGLLPWLRLYDVDRNAMRFRCRLVGTAAVDLYGDHTGRWLDEAFPEFRTTTMLSEYVTAVETGRPGYYRGPPRLSVSLGQELQSVERLLLPLARDGEHVDMLLSLTVFNPNMYRRR